MKKFKAREITEEWEISQDEQPHIDLDLYGNPQYLQEDKCEAVWRASDPSKTLYKLNRKPVKGTLTGTIYNDGVAIQTVVENEHELTLTKIKESVAFVRGGRILHATGEVILEWSGVPGTSDRLVASYEYNLENNTLHNRSSLSEYDILQRRSKNR